MVKVRVLSCVTCGAPMRLPAHRTRVTCPYCEHELVIEASGDNNNQGHTVRDTQSGGAVPLAARLLRDHTHPARGDGQRYDVAAMSKRDWKCHERGLWPVSARASSEFGSGWKAKAIIGAPRVYPACGDRMGAWAPRSRDSKTEWIEASYPDDAPAIKAIRVFETCVPGATFAVTMDTGEGEELVWCRPPGKVGKTRHMGQKGKASGAQVLEIRVTPARRVRKVRAYVDNSMLWSWSEIDTIGLVATDRVPMRLRRKTGFLTVRGWILVLLASVFLGGALFAAQASSSGSSFGSGSGSGSGGASGRRLGGQVPQPRLADIAAVTTLEPWIADAVELRGDDIVWARSVERASSEYGDSTWSANQVTGRPNVYPRHGDIGQAWASRQPDQGSEWLELTLHRRGVRTRALLIVETFNPGAIVRIDDISDNSAPVVLWSGRTEPLANRSRVLRLSLPSPRVIRRVRVVLDSRLVRGWNEIDAIGAVRGD